MRIETEEYLDFSDVLLKPKRSTLISRSEAILFRELKFLHCNNIINVIPICCSNMDSVGTFGASDLLENNNMFGVIHKHYSVQQYVDFFKNKVRHSFISLGSKDSDFEKYCKISNEISYFPNVCIDVANGYSQNFVDYVKKFRDLVGTNSVIMAGNVATPEITEELLLQGADIVKLGIGSGAMCTTRIVAGVGVPQLTCVVECSDAAHGIGGMVCSDGGIGSPGDLVKAFGAGADIVMVGTEFSAHTENSVDDEYVSVYGMSSSTAMEKHYGGVASYRSSEGRTANIKHRGSLQGTIDYYLGGLRSGMTYIGAKKIKEVPKRATFIKVNRVLNDKYRDVTEKLR